MRTAIIAVVMVASQVLAAQSDLTKQFETAKKQVEGGSVVAYSNGLVVAAAKLKQAGDLDNYLKVQAEMKRLVSEGTLDAGVTNSNSFVSDVALKSLVERNGKMVSLLKAYASALDAEMRKLMVADKLDEAKAVKDKADAVKFELADLEVKTPKEPAKKEIPSIAGKWRIQYWDGKQYVDINLFVTITQRADKWSGLGLGDGPNQGMKCRWEGTITDSGDITGKWMWTKAPSDKKDRTLTLKLSKDGTLEGAYTQEGQERRQVFMLKKTE